MKLVIVESRRKAARIQRLLGPGYRVVACFGRLRDLPEDELGVQLDPPTFEPRYVIREGRAKLIAKLRHLARLAEEVILATDADREGEAIAWHAAQVLGLREPNRIRYREVTAEALKAAIARPGRLDMRLVEAQQARRILDRLVGYQISPLLRPFGPNHSAGRVQSATLHLVAQRERERWLFQPVPYWVLRVRYDGGLDAKCATPDAAGELVKTRFASPEAASAVAQRASGPHTVRSVEKALVERAPPPPFTTGTVLQAASTQLGMRLSRAMTVLRDLYERGFVTYHLTESSALSDDAVAMAQAFLARDCPAALPPQPRRDETKAAPQEIHEAIRPTSFEPGSAAALTSEHRALYELIWTRALVSQCRPAVYEQTTLALVAGATTWRLRGLVLRSDGFLRYLRDDGGGDGQRLPPALAPVELGQALTHGGIDVVAMQTEPPPRLTEAVLLGEMERLGIGRPATYSSTIETLTARGYLRPRQSGSEVVPTPRGMLIDEVVEDVFVNMVQPSYTADMEAALDEVAEGRRDWRSALSSWYVAFSRHLDGAGEFLAQVATVREPIVLGE